MRAAHTKHYDGFSLEGVDLAVNEGEVVGFVGQNGAGKSTTIKALLGLIRVDGGEGSVLGTPSDELTRASGRRRRSASASSSTPSRCPGTSGWQTSGASTRAPSPPGTRTASRSSPATSGSTPRRP